MWGSCGHCCERGYESENGLEVARHGREIQRQGVRERCTRRNKGRLGGLQVHRTETVNVEVFF
jgi:hypothetical protein